MRTLELIAIVAGAWWLYTHRKSINVNWPEVVAYSVVGLAITHWVRH